MTDDAGHPSEIHDMGGLIDDVSVAPLSGMQVVADLGDDGKWFEIFTQPEANQASLLTETAIHIFFAKEGKLESGHPRRWFLFVGPEGRGDVCLYVIPAGAEINERWPNDNGTHTTGYRNKNPYPDFAPQVETLSQAIGVDIAPDYMGRNVKPDTYGMRT